MNERERIIHLWFDMWLKQQDLGIDSGYELFKLRYLPDICKLV